MTKTKINTAGKCILNFLNKIEKELKKAGRDSIEKTAEDTVRHCVDAYTKKFGGTDVGANAKGKVTTLFAATKTEPIPNGTTGLLYGKVQSGKTNAAIATVAMARENGFRCIIVLTSDNTLLGKQTLKRFTSRLGNSGPLVCGWEDWSKNPGGFGADLKKKNRFDDTAVVFVSTKNQSHLATLLDTIKASGASKFPGLIIDDEADHASLNTATAKNAKKGTNDASAIFEAIGELRQAVPNHIYLQVTATPQSLLLQTITHPAKPVFCVLVPPGQDYMGGDIFFADDPQAKLRRIAVNAAEFDELRGGSLNPGGTTSAPDGLRSALCTFFVGAAQMQLAEKDDDASYTILIHLSQKKQDHDHLKTIVGDFVTLVDQSIRGKKTPTAEKTALGWLQSAYNNLSTTAKLHPFDDIIEHLKETLTNVIPVVMDADNPNSEVDYKQGMNILIGGNRLGRGLTIEGLMVTYYGRDPKTPMSDTVHQHARMFGYRHKLLNLTRLFSAPHLIDGFTVIHDADEAMRDVIGDDPDNLPVKPVWVGGALKPTRSNVLNPAEVGAIRTGVAIYPPDPMWKKSDVGSEFKQLDAILAPYSGDDTYHQVGIDLLIEILGHMKSNQIDGYNWEDNRVLEVLNALKAGDLKITTGRLNVRRGKNGKGLELTRQTNLPWKGFASSGWTQKAKNSYKEEPTLIVMMQEGSKKLGWEGERVYLPTLVLPSTKFVFMFNYS